MASALVTRPWRLSRLLLTFPLPAIPLFTLWDATVSALRVYSPDELRGLIREIPDGATYLWDLGQLPVGPGRVTYLVGRPRT